MRSPRWEHDVENYEAEVGERASWLLVLEDVAFRMTEKMGLYLSSYGRELFLEAVQHLEQEGTDGDNAEGGRASLTSS